MMIKRLLLLVCMVGILAGCQSLSDPKEVQDALLSFYPKITLVTFNDSNVPVIVWDNPDSRTRDVAGSEIYILSPTQSDYSTEPSLIVTSNVSLFASRDLFKDGFGIYKFKMKSVDKDGVPGLFSEEISVYFSGFHKSLDIISGFGSKDTFDQPMDMAQDSKGNLYVLDTGHCRVVKLNSSGEFVEEFGSKGSGVGQFSYPLGITIDNHDNIFVSDSGNDRMVYFNPDDFSGSFKTLGEKGTALGQFNQPVGCYTIGDYLFVADVNNNRVQIITLTHDDDVWSSDTVSKLPFKRGFLSVWGISGYDTSLFIVDKGAGTVYVVDTKGEITASLGSKGDREGELLDPRFVAYDEGRSCIYVANHGNHTIDAFRLNGTFIERWGVKGSDAQQMISPIAITVYQGKAFVLERGNDRIQIFKL